MIVGAEGEGKKKTGDRAGPWTTLVPQAGDVEHLVVVQGMLIISKLRPRNSLVFTPPYRRVRA
jgi:hypothetical protein